MASYASLLFFSVIFFLASAASASQSYDLALVAAASQESTVSDAVELSLDALSNHWVQFAAPSCRRRDVCGWSLALQFNKVAGELYIADAEDGLLRLEPRVGIVAPVNITVDGQQLPLTNRMDIKQADGLLYFTDASTVYTRNDSALIVATGDRTGRLMSYNPVTKQAEVVLRGLAFPSGVALSKDGSFLLVVEISSLRVMRYWLAGPRAGSYEVFADVPGHPDNIRRNAGGEFWVAFADDWTSGSSVAGGTVVRMKFDAEGQVLEVVERREVEEIVSDCEVEDNIGGLWIGEVDVSPFVGVFITPL